MLVKGFEQDTTIEIITSDNDTLRKSGSYFYNPPNALKKDTLTAYKDGKVIAKSVFSIENLRFPKIFLGNIRDTFVTVKDILNNAELVVSYEPQLAIPYTYVYAFNGVIIKTNGEQIPLPEEMREGVSWSYKKQLKELRRNNNVISRAKLNSYQIKLIKSMKSGDVLYIQDVTLICPSCILIRITVNLRFTIK